MDEPRDGVAPPVEAAQVAASAPDTSDVEAAEAELDAYHDQLLAAEVRAAIETDEDGDVRFTSTLDPASARFGETAPLRPSCQWCTAELPVADAARCPTCGALLQPIDDEPDVPGITSMSDEARASLEREARRRLSMADTAPSAPQDDPELVAATGLTPPADLFEGAQPRESYAPPSAEVRKMMRRILWEAIEADPVGFVDPGPLSDARKEEEPQI
jgi:hypothetical protein